MNEKHYLDIVSDKFSGKTKEMLENQIQKYYEIINFLIPKHHYKIGEEVKLKKGTLLHGTYKNLDGLKEIALNGLLSSYFIDGRLSKYPGCVGVWNLKKDYLLKDYINFYSGGTIMYASENEKVTEVIPYDKMNNINDILKEHKCHMWVMEQTKEARFMPSLAQDEVNVGIIFNAENEKIKELLNMDILSNTIDDESVKDFINPDYYDKFIKDRKNKDDFFTDRESAILFGIPANFIEGVLVGRIYENDIEKIKTIKEILPDAYICNLDGKVICV